MIKKTWHKLDIFLPLLISLILYLPLINGYFQQDEWFGYGQYAIHKNDSLISLIKYYFAPSNVHYTPVALVIENLSYRFVGLNYHYFIFLSIFLNMVVVLLVYLVSKKLFKDGRLALIASVLFATQAVGTQGTSWVVADIGTHLSAIFALLSLISLFVYVEKNKKKHLLLTLVLLVASLLFKENTIAMFIVLPIAYVLFSTKKLKAKTSLLKVFAGWGAFFVLVRVGMYLFAAKTPGVKTVTESQPIIKLIYNCASFPIKALSQSIVPHDIYSPLLSSKLGFELFNYFVFVLILLLVLISSLLRKDNRIRKVALFSLLFVVLNGFIYALSPARSGVIAEIDSRNLYFPAIGTSILITSIYGMLSRFKKISLLSIILLVFMNVFLVVKSNASLVKTGEVRKEVITQFQNVIKDLPDDVVVYIESDKAYYGLPDQVRTVPFQSGFGQTLLSLYDEKENLPSDMFKDRFLWELTSQGYKKVNSRGFGYYRNFDDLLKFIIDSDYEVENIISLRYDSFENKLIDISDEVRGRIIGYKANKQALLPIDFGIESSVNNPEVKLVIDGDVSTFWDSGLPYNRLQYITFGLPETKAITGISINSGDDPGQIASGYRVLVSSDGMEWSKIYYSKNQFPKNGIVDIYFRPANTKFVKLEQVGQDQVATWVVHEIILYEVKNNSKE